MALYGKYKTKILGTGQFAPEKMLTNKDLEKLVETNDEWIFERTGIRARRIAKEDEVTSDLAMYAAKEALKEAGKTAEDLDMIIFATVSPDQVMPSAACELQNKLGCRNIMAFDLSAACTGFVYALSVADQFIRSGQYENILVVGAEILNRYVNYKDSIQNTETVRKIDAAHAIERAKSLPFVDADNMLLIGLSEGGITTATFTSMQKDLSVRARVVEGWTCHTGWMDQIGVRAPASEPVLSLVGANDPWFQKPYLQGHCGETMYHDNGSKSVVYETGKLSYRHELLEFREVQEETLAFLRLHMDLPLSVRDIQELLTELGYDPGPIDGAWGAKTLRAVNALRTDKSLPPVTKLDRASQNLLQSLESQ